MYSDGGAVGTPCVRYAGLCTVGWVYCGGSGGTLGVHYAGLSVLWDGCIVMEGRMESILWIACIVVEGRVEHRMCAVVPTVCCSGSIGVPSRRI